ncbi:MAG: HAMP domain-containing histidine kinase [Phycisphaerales bacterium]|nr:HAMP domain-containing histidine kinase [Phycisphaerales bacterium]
MSLRRKFAILLVLFGLTVAGSMAVAIWTFEVLEREVARPFMSVASVMADLGQLKQGVENQADVVRQAPRIVGPGDSLARPALDEARTFDAATLQIRRGIASVRQNQASFSRIGKGTSRNIEFKIAELLDVGDSVLVGGDQARKEFLELASALHELIERVETQILEEARLTTNFDDSVRRRLLEILGLTFAGALLVGVLARLFISRWIMRPVAGLRIAAARIASGDFSHRIVEPDTGDEIAALSREVNHMAGMVEAMQEERIERERLAAVGEMVRRLAHNLRNPLAGIRGLAELSRSDLPPGSETRDYQERIIQAVDRFEQWLKELLNATSPQNIRPEPIRIEPWLRGLVQSHEPMATTKGVHLGARLDDSPDEAVIDQRHLEHAVVAILSNAIEATPPGGSVLVECRPDGPTDWSIRISDDGPGVAPELLERIFRPYFTTKRDGNGIGLAVAQQVVRVHGGQIEVSTAGDRHGGLRPQRGATFRIRLPLRPPTPADHVALVAGRSEC